jgi:hypothetical protein
MEMKDNGIEKKGLEKRLSRGSGCGRRVGKRVWVVMMKKKRHAQKQKKGKNNSRCLAM